MDVVQRHSWLDVLTFDTAGYAARSIVRGGVVDAAEAEPEIANVRKFETLTRGAGASMPVLLLIHSQIILIDEVTKKAKARMRSTESTVKRI